MSKTLIICHVVFPTHKRKPSITPTKKRELYKVMFGLLKNKKYWVERINGMPDHIHMLFDLHPNISLANLVKELKVSTSKWLKSNPDFPHFDGWGQGYFAISVSPDDKESVKQYIMGQDTHHSGQKLLDEMEYMVRSYDMEWYPDDWE